MEEMMESTSVLKRKRANRPPMTMQTPLRRHQTSRQCWRCDFILLLLPDLDSGPYWHRHRHWHWHRLIKQVTYLVNS